MCKEKDEAQNCFLMHLEIYTKPLYLLFVHDLHDFKGILNIFCAIICFQTVLTLCIENTANHQQQTGTLCATTTL